MENILLVPATRASAWVDAVLPGTSPAELPVAGLRLADIQLECSFRYSDVFFAEILDWRHSERLAADFSELTKTGRAVFYTKGEGEPPRGLVDLEGLKTPLTETISDGLVVVFGPCIDLDKTEAPVLTPISVAETRETPPGVYIRSNGEWCRIESKSITLDGITAWHKANIDLLSGAAAITLPGYSAENGIMLGRNAVYERGTTIKPPALLHDNSWCARNVRILGGVVVGRNSFVAEGCTLSNTVILDNTFVGEALELKGKIVAGARIIDAASETWVDMDDPGVACSTRVFASGGNFLKRAVNAFWHFLKGHSAGREA